jgi:hypothetical protein
LQRLQSVLHSKEQGSRDREEETLKILVIFKNRQRFTKKSCRRRELLKNSKNSFKFAKDSCRRQNRLKIYGNRSNLSKIVAENEESVNFFQIFERFTDPSSTGAKNASQVQRTTVRGRKIRPENGSEAGNQFRRDEESEERRKNFSRWIFRRGPTVVGSARRCTRFSPLERTGEIFDL